MRILFTGGGTGGHIYPIIAIKEALEKIRPAAKILYVGPDGFARNAFKEEEVKSKFILAGKLRRYFSPLNFIDIFKTPIGLIQSLWYVLWFMPDVIFSKGGYGSIPVVFVGWLYKIPIIIHESDSVPGLANKIMSIFSKRIIVSFEETKKHFLDRKTILLGNPIREELTQGNKEKGKKIFGLSSGRPVVLIMGGSQGAQKINEIVLNTLPRLLERCEIIHVCGKKNLKSIESEANKILEDTDKSKLEFYNLHSFLTKEELKHAYAISDIVISRAGAGSIFAIAANGKPSILIPLYTAASDHQTKNAWALTSINGAIELREANLTMNIFLDAVFNLIDDRAYAKKIGEKAKTFYKPETNQKIAEEITSLCHKK